MLPAALIRALDDIFLGEHMNEETITLKSLAEFIYGILSLCGIFAASYLSWKTYKRQEAAYNREEAHNAVLTQETFEDFEGDVSFCELVNLEIANCSKYSASYKVDIYTNGFSIHYDRGKNHPSHVYSRMSFNRVVILPNEVYRETFRIHTLDNPPATADVTIYLNGKQFKRFKYGYDINHQSYYSC